ncbi:MAG: hypothetical protein AAGA83_11740 [Cyanobacteria bacterium P01_F01_bin.116]
MLMELCPCCGVRLLRHASKSGTYLRCGSCRFEIPEELPSVTDKESKVANSLLDKLDTVETVTAS